MEVENKSKHQILRRQTFKAAINLKIFFSDKEISVLEKYGVWMQALANGQLKPYTSEQSHFVAVANQQENPVSEYELLWIKYCQFVYKDQQAEKTRLMRLVDSKTLSFEQLQLVMDNASRLDFSKDELYQIRNEINRKSPVSISTDPFVVFSKTDGQ